MKNILIKNGLVFTGDKDDRAAIGHILIEEGMIKKICSELFEVPSETEIIDASGKWITPGFINTHTHYDAEVIASPGLKESARHGVTNIVLGSCSVSAVLNSPEDTADTFARVEAIPREVMLPLLERTKIWQSPKEWVSFIEKQNLGINVGSFIGHSDLRTKVLGMRRSVTDNEMATEQEKKQMTEILSEALDEGFIGMSTMDNPWDKMDGDKYWSHKTPSFYGSWKERKPLIELLRKRGRVLQGAPNLVTRVNAGNYLLASTGIGRKPLKTTMIALMDLIGDRYIMNLSMFLTKFFNKFLNADFRMQSPPAPFTVYYDGCDSVMFEEFPSGEAIRHLAKNLDERNELIKDKTFRENFKKEIKNRFAPKVWHKDLSIAFIIDCPDKSLIGKNFMQIAEEKNSHPVDAFLDLIVDYDKEIRWVTTIANDRPEQVHKIINYPHNIISFSDAGAHLRNMAFYDFPLKMMKMVKESAEKGKEIMPMEKCIWRLTKEQSDWFGLETCHLAEGKSATLNIINPEKFGNVSEEIFEEKIEEFDNYSRLVNRAEDLVEKVFVNGNLIFENCDFVEGYGKTKKFGKFLKAR